MSIKAWLIVISPVIEVGAPLHAAGGELGAGRACSEEGDDDQGRGNPFAPDVADHG